jgi:CBS domain containing-hemolysin-like protein
MSDLTAVLVAIGLLAANAFFVGSEFALISARRTQIEPRVEKGSRAARSTLRAMEQVSLVMAGAQLGITACSLGLGAIGEPAVAHLIEPLMHGLGIPDGLLHPISFAIALTIVVYLHVVLGEMVPKNIAIAGPERAALVLGPPMMVVVTIMRPLVALLNAIANAVLRLLRVDPKDEISSTFTRDEVASMLEESREEGLLEGQEYDRLASTLGFTERTVERVILPPDTLVTVPRGCPVVDIEAACAETGFSRFPVETDGEMLGYVHVKDVLDTDPQGDARLEDQWLRSFATVRPAHRLHEALSVLRGQGAHMGRVVDDDGSFLGVVTLEDMLEELVGEIRDALNAVSRS